MDNKARFSICAAAIGLAIAGAARADGVKFQDPIGDDKGPGTYTYPTDAVYTQGSFDLTEFEITAGDSPEVKVSVNSKLADPWGMGVGFATQMVFIFIDKDGKAGSGHTDGLPGLNIQFAPESAWEKVIILSPQPQARVLSEIKVKAAALAEAGRLGRPMRYLEFEQDQQGGSRTATAERASAGGAGAGVRAHRGRALHELRVPTARRIAG